MDSMFLTFAQLNTSKNPKSKNFSFFEKRKLGSSIKLQYMTKRTKGYVTPASKKSPFKTSTGTHLGPGKYNSRTQSDGPKFEFSRLERFESADYSSKTFLFRRKSADEKEKIQSRIEKNKETAAKTKAEKLKTLKDTAKKRNFKAKVVKMAKKQILSEKKHSFSVQLNEKFQKFEYRKRLGVFFIQEIAEIKKFWVVFNVFVGVSSITRCFISNKKKLRFRALRKLLRFRLISMFIGKIVLKIKKFRISKATKVIFIQVIRRYSVPFVRKWLFQSKKNMEVMVLDTVEKILSSTMLFSLISKWINKLIILQRFIKKALFYKRSLYESLVLKWNKTEFKLYKKTTTKEKKSNKSNKNIKETEESQGSTSIPLEIKLFYIRTYIKTRLCSYIQDYKSYKSRVFAIHKENLAKKWSSNDLVLDYPIAPEKPLIYEEFTLKRLEEMIQKALRDRHEWSNLLEKQQKTHGKSNKRKIFEKIEQQ